MNLNEKIKMLISTLQMTPSQFADEIGVQRSSISHILSGRNKPSLEIIQKIVNSFPEVTYGWLLGNDAFDLNTSIVSSRKTNAQLRNYGEQELRSKLAPDEMQNQQLDDSSDKTESRLDVKPRRIEKILIFYSDNTFSEYLPTLRP
mgnify:CR=1 FL=1